MLAQIRRSKEGLTINLPEEILAKWGLTEGSEINVHLDESQRQLVLTPADAPAAEIDPDFAAQVAEFIEQYRPALIELAK